MRTNSFLLAAGVVLVMAFMFSCSQETKVINNEQSNSLYCDYGPVTQWGGGCFEMEHENDCDLEWGEVVEVCGDYSLSSSSSLTQNGLSSSSSNMVNNTCAANSLGMGYNVLNSGYPNAKEVSTSPILDQNRMCQDGIIEFGPSSLNSFSQGTGSSIKETYQSMNLDLKLGASFDIAVFFSVKLDAAFSVNSSTTKSQSYFYSQLRSYRYVQDHHIKSGEISVQNLSKYLSPALISDLQTKNAAQILDLYGTHTFIQYYKGGSLQSNYVYKGTSLTSKEEMEAAVKGSVKKFGAGVSIGVGVGSTESVSALESDMSFSYEACGGNDLGVYEIGELGGAYSGWSGSIDNKPELCGIKDFTNSFISIWDLVRAAGYSNQATALYDEFARRAEARGIFISSVSPTPCTPEDNSSTHYCSNGFLREYGRVTHSMQTYKTVVIGTQTWLAENLNVKQNSYCYDGLSENCTKYGGLYDWAAAMDLSSSCNNSICSIQLKHQGICPNGWHIPSSDEWNTLVGFVESNSKCSNCAGTKLKASSGWDNNGNGTDNYGFTALPAGYRRGDQYLVKGTSSSWWNATAIELGPTADYIRMLSNSNSTEISSNVKVNGNPVRCVKN
jgi:uncharacterized protein (TIGR02145 family)